MTSAPAVCALGSDYLGVFSRGLDAGMWHKYFIYNNWSQWENLGGRLTSAPACSSIRDQNIMHTISANLDGKPQRKSFNKQW